MVPYAREDELELLVVAGAPESHALHALIDGHDIVLPTDGAGGGPVAHRRAIFGADGRSKRASRRKSDGTSALLPSAAPAPEKPPRLDQRDASYLTYDKYIRSRTLLVGLAMAKNEARARALSGPSGVAGKAAADGEKKREKRTITEIRESKRTGEKMVYMSVPDYTSAKWAEMAGVDVAVVGDSLAMVAHGHPNTIPASMDMMIMHAQAVRRGAPNTFVLGCMPYQSYNTIDRALVNATRFMQEALSDAVKPQGGKSQAHILRSLVDAGIPTASHIGLTPHTIAMFGGFKIQGRRAEAAMKILEDALAIEDAGCFMLEFEAVPAKIAKLISEQLSIPTIGIGAGAGTDGQILLCYDLLGVFTDFKPKFTKRYAKLTEFAVAGVRQYVEEVKQGIFPDDDHSYTVDDAEYEKFAAMVAKRRQV
jgi:3-methyl-2-oxobutanoate hydroxymethyltransferase